MKFFLISLFLITMNIDSFAETIQPLSSYELKAREALESIVKDQVVRIEEKTNSTGSANEENIKGFVLSTHIRSFEDIPVSIDREIQKIKNETRLLIRHIATDIELNGRNTSGSLIVDDKGNINYQPNSKLPEKLNKKREKLLKAGLKNSVSVRSAAMAFQLLANVNKALIIRGNEAKNRRDKEKSFIAQAIFVYEMSDIVLDLVDNLSLGGSSTIKNLHKQAEGRVDKRYDDIESLKSNAKKLFDRKDLTKEQLDNEISAFEYMQKANKKSMKSWAELVNIMNSQQDFLDKIKTKKELIRYKREKARVQLETLRDLRQLAELRDAIGPLDDLLASVGSLDLLVLDEHTVSVLLGYDVRE